MPPDEPNDEEKLEKLPDDNQMPFNPAAPNLDETLSSNCDDIQAKVSTLDDTHPATDSGLDPQEIYDEGIAGAAEVKEPNSGNSVTSYSEPIDDTEE
jgi:hypothetical protein